MSTPYKASVATICVVAVLLTASTACRKTPVIATGEAVDYDVLSAFIDNKFTSRKGVEPIEPVGHGIARIVIFNQTESDQYGPNVRLDGNGQPIPWTQAASSLQNKAPTLKRTTIDAFREMNKQQASVRRSFHPAFDYELVNSIELDSIFKNGDWPAYYKRFPGSPGILTFSRVGCSAVGTQALFYLTNRCGELCGTGMYVVMEKRDGRWVVETEIEMWVS
jgi:hypothetical protein